MSFDRGAPQDRPDDMIRSEEELVVDRESSVAGYVRARKVTDHEHVSETHDREVEHAEAQVSPADEGDSGEVLTLPDGSLSIPVFEEQLVVEKRRVVKERVILRKRTVVEEELIETDLARERVEISADPQVVDRVHDAQAENAPPVRDR